MLASHMSGMATGAIFAIPAHIFLNLGIGHATGIIFTAGLAGDIFDRAINEYDEEDEKARVLAGSIGGMVGGVLSLSTKPQFCGVPIMPCVGPVFAALALLNFAYEFALQCEAKKLYLPEVDKRANNSGCLPT